MQFELSVAIAAMTIFASIMIDWPRALAGLVLGGICRFLPYGTILVPVGVILISAVGELIYPLINRNAEPHLWSFVVGLFAAGSTASSLFVTIRNLKDRL